MKIRFFQKMKSRVAVAAPSLCQKNTSGCEKSLKIMFSGPWDVKIEFLTSKQWKNHYSNLKKTSGVSRSKISSNWPPILRNGLELPPIYVFCFFLGICLDPTQILKCLIDGLGCVKNEPHINKNQQKPSFQTPRTSEPNSWHRFLLYCTITT